MIKVTDLVFKYPTSKKNALNGLNLEIKKGQYVAILGHNGSGKSTFSKLLVALYKPLSGKIEIDGITISSETLRKIRKKIGIIFQNPDNQFIGATVEDDIAFGLENAQINPKEMRSIIEMLSEKVGMDKYLNREPQLLSGGQKQRVAIASVLALNPEIIIFDEVTSMLDPKGKRKVLEIIRDIQKQREKTLISITHDMDEAIMADLCIVFANGEVIASGEPKEILKNKEIIEIAKIDSPFIYRLSEKIYGIEPTYDEKELLEKLCK
ncbi:ATPase component of general energizing module [Mycoplasmopsis meleagridis]|uniref:Cobalt ABC transporter ATPase component, ATP-binding protein n=1 Tax=Mycoplasmopsis meleagridis ATCC 25294 TaxID=1264554 RepID=A0A0F5GZY1_9BACT|nr:energy-coupling factor transporter ATPase [Mycoplasmopsis meleagridis]KKB26589.1 Cobalt ABC transporter ATPase component, ATP-binding protein [Mycoplasmopsis meleagridis ATCC 25294]KUH47505.1 energy-coupling factor transporter ATPase [Mycoplasmopsis meleagridis]OAD18458.1 ATPase component of general energizing module [Mycoplasmopsis meleagridis]VEU77673.1 cobalt ABC transporter ATPase component [Mycoplasmopsis meleagridis]